MRAVVFSGTTEGRAFSKQLGALGADVLVSVATDLGAEEQGSAPGVTVRAGRLEPEEMTALLQGADLCIDATHPYAVEVTEHIRAAAEAAGLPVLRLVRQSDGGELCRRAKDMAGAADMLEQMPGHVLLTTGSKELHHFARPGLAERCYPRVLPMADSLERCLTLGFPPKNIICMQGPFSRELNVALLRQYHIQTLVTKDTGGYGGFREKAEAAREALRQDRERARLYGLHTGAKWGEVGRYDLTVDSGPLGVSGTVELLSQFIALKTMRRRSKEAAHAGTTD